MTFDQLTNGCFHLRMRAKRTALAVALGLAASVVAGSAEAKKWKDVTPGKTNKAEVIKRFGEPTKRLPKAGKETLSYLDDEAISGSQEAQFVAGKDGTIEQIIVFPTATLEKSEVESTFGPECAAQPGPPPAPGAKPVVCYTRKLNEEELRTYFWYQRLGLVVFFGKDGKSVQSLLYIPQNAGLDGQPVEAPPAKGAKPSAALNDEP